MISRLSCKSDFHHSMIGKIYGHMVFLAYNNMMNLIHEWNVPKPGFCRLCSVFSDVRDQFTWEEINLYHHR